MCYTIPALFFICTKGVYTVPYINPDNETRIQGEMNELLEPSLYIGRCAEQVDALAAKIQPLLKGIDRSNAQISL